MIHAIYDAKRGKARSIETVEELRAMVDAGEGVIWVHLHDCDPEEYEIILRDVFNFHPLAIEDTLSKGYQPPKVDDFGSHIFVIVHAIVSGADLTELSTEELNCFLGPNYLVTATHAATIAPVETVWERVHRDERIFERGVDFLMHTLIDTVVDEFLPFLDRIDEEVDRIEDQIILKPEAALLRRILDLKHTILALRRITSPQREVMQRLSRGEFEQISEQSRIYFRDIYDHLVRVHDLSESLRDVVSGALDTYLSVSSNKLNEIMKALTMVSTIFLPLTLVTSMYGMNFDVMPELHWRYGYLMVWIVMAVIIIGMLWFFRRRRWI